MVKKLSLIAAVVCMLFMAGCGEKAIAPAQLPQSIQTFVQQNFPGQTITFAKEEGKLFGTEYELVLADGTKITFDSEAWNKVESTVSPIPAALIPAPIATYVSTNFPSVAIVKIDKERYGYEVELANDIELKFNEQGAIMDMDN